MSRFLIATIPAFGHVTPLIAIAEQLTSQGHEVVWYTGELFRSRIENIAKFRPILSSPDYVSTKDIPKEIVAERESLKGIKQIKYDLKNFFVKPSVGYYKDLCNILDEFNADAIISDSFFIAASWINEKYNIPWVQVCVSVLAFNGTDVAPFGLGLQPDSGVFGKLRNIFLNNLMHQLIFKEVLDFSNSERSKIGLSPTKISFQNIISPNLYISGSIEEFEYIRSELPPQVHFVGPLQSSILQNYQLPDWWEDLYSNDKPVVVVTQGTVANNLEELVLPTIHALRNEDFLVVVTTGGVKPEELELGDLSRNVRIESFIPFHLLFPFVDLMISNGGFNGVMTALSYGIPIVAAGKTEDKAEVAGRIQYSGVGINLKTNTPSPDQIKNAVLTVIGSDTYKSNAMQLKKIIDQLNSSQHAVELIEELLSHSHEPEHCVRSSA